jgi:hypothetical protein
LGEWSQAGPLTPRSPVALPSWATSHESRVTSHERRTPSSELRASSFEAVRQRARSVDSGQAKSIAELAAWRSAPRVDQCRVSGNRGPDALVSPQCSTVAPSAVCLGRWPCMRMRMLVLADGSRRWQAILRPAMPFATCRAQIPLALLAGPSLASLPAKCWESLCRMCQFGASACPDVGVRQARLQAERIPVCAWPGMGCSWSHSCLGRRRASPAPRPCPRGEQRKAQEGVADLGQGSSGSPAVLLKRLLRAWSPSTILP